KNHSSSLTTIVLGIAWWHSDSSTPRGLQDQVSAIMTAMGVRSVNLIKGVCFASRKGCAVTETTLHHINEENPICPN
ncbi:hypothetical protein MKX01_037414, partial [Papaver californicum]